MTTGSLRRVGAALGILGLATTISACGSEPAPKSASPAIQVPSPAAPSVTVASVHDAATIVLTDGTRLRQVGISAPSSDTCQAKQATATADSAVHESEPGEDADTDRAAPRTRRHATKRSRMEAVRR
jgi:hypothetical protein